MIRRNMKIYTVHMIRFLEIYEFPLSLKPFPSLFIASISYFVLVLILSKYSDFNLGRQIRIRY